MEGGEEDELADDEVEEEDGISHFQAGSFRSPPKSAHVALGASALGA